MRRSQNNECEQRARRARLLGSRHWRIAVIPVIALVFWSVRVSAGEAVPTEYQVKAAFLFNFAKFVEWPPSSFASPQASFSICILGADPFGEAIDDTLRGQTIRGRTVTVQRVRDAVQLRHCQVAFISASEKGNLQEILQRIRGASVLAVGETPGFAASGGTIEFEMQDRHIRFSINPAAAERAGLRVSSKLLSLATIVYSEASNGTG